MSLPASILSGFQRADMQLQAAGSNISRAFMPDAKAVQIEGDKLVQTEDQIDLSSEMVSMKMAETLHSAVVKVVQTDKETTKALLDMMG